VLVGEDGGLIAGHARILAARQLGIAEIPVMVAAGWSEAQKRAYVLADNQLAITGSGWVELTSLILGRSVRVTSTTHGEAELEDTVRALRNPGSAAGRLLAAGEGGRLITTSGPKSAVVLESCLADNIASPANDIERGGLLRIANPNRRGRWQSCGKTALVSFGRSRR
jgi:hypothetical protein